MGDINVTNPGELSNVLNDHQKDIDATKARLDQFQAFEEIPDAVTKLREETERLKGENEQLKEKMKEVTIAAKARGSWKAEDTKEAKAYGIGKTVQLMLEAKQGSRRAHVDLVNMGCISAKPSSDPHQGWTTEEGVREKHVNKDVVVKAGLSSLPLTGDDSVGSYYGSYTIPVEYRGELERVALDNSAMMGLVNTVPVPGITSYVPTTTDELTWTAVTNQNTDKNEETLTFGRATLTTVTYASYIAIVEEFLEDTLVAAGAAIRDMFGEAWGKKFDTLALSDSTYGAMSTTGINSKVMDTGDVAFTDLNLEYMHNLIQELDSQNKRNGARFFIHVTNWDAVRTEKDADGNYKLGPPNDGIAQRCWGYPVIVSDGMPDSSDTAISTAFVAFGNPRFIWNGVKVGYEFKIYDQTQSAMESGQIFLRVRTRQAFVCAVPSAWAKLTTAAS